MQELPSLAGVAKFLRACENCRKHPYYTGPFEHFEEVVVEDVTWDISPTLAILPRSPCDILEIGSGRGRITVALLEHGYNVTAIDSSPTALLKLRDRLRLARLASKCEIVETLFEEYRSDRKFDAVLLANLSVNLFQAPELARLLVRVRSLLKPNGSFCLAVIDQTGLAPFSAYDGSVLGSLHVQGYLDEEDTRRLMIMEVAFDPQREILRQDWFVDLNGSTLYTDRFHSASLVERLWTIETLSPMLKAHGFVIASNRFGFIEKGGAGGQRVCFIRCCMESSTSAQLIVSIDTSTAEGREKC